MKSSTLIAILAATTLGLSLPARADQAVVNESNQTAIITGSYNSVSQSNTTTIRDRSNRRGNTGTSVRNSQTADVLGDGNTIRQTNRTEVENRRQSR